MDLPTLTRQLEHFTTTTSHTPHPYLHLYTYPPTSAPPSTSSPPPTLAIFDSSFNPPTLAHLSLALSLLPPTPPSRILLLLSTSNPDKTPVPLPFPNRLHLLRHLPPYLHRHASAPTVDVAVCKAGRFIDKEPLIRRAYTGSETGGGVRLVWGVGWDTWVRIVDERYYPEGMGGVEGFLSRCDVRVLVRDEGTKEECEAAVKGRDGVQVVDVGSNVRDVSSTRVRRAVRELTEEEEQRKELEACLVKEVADEILLEGYYR